MITAPYDGGQSRPSNLHESYKYLAQKSDNLNVPIFLRNLDCELSATVRFYSKRYSVKRMR